MRKLLLLLPLLFFCASPPAHAAPAFIQSCISGDQTTGPVGCTFGSALGSAHLIVGLAIVSDTAANLSACGTGAGQGTPTGITVSAGGTLVMGTCHYVCGGGLCGAVVTFYILNSGSGGGTSISTSWSGNYDRMAVAAEEVSGTDTTPSGLHLSMFYDSAGGGSTMQQPTTVNNEWVVGMNAEPPSNPIGLTTAQALGCGPTPTYRGDSAAGSQAGLEDGLVPTPCSGAQSSFGGSNNGGFYEVDLTLVFFPSGGSGSATQIGGFLVGP